jgi:methylenetetrahydrofolate--tRNA-(uracil-5-)-methyltransferase
MAVMNRQPVHVIGGGLAGSECAYQLASRGTAVVLHEMRPAKKTPAHKTGDLAELVCSNSFRSDDPAHAAGLLKREMELFSSLILRAARSAAVPAGAALAVDRDCFAGTVTDAISSHPLIELRHEEVTQLPDGDVVLATGPLTSAPMSRELEKILGSDHLYFYDSIAPIVDAESLDLSRLFWASRYDKGGGNDYLNAALSKTQYLALHEQLMSAEVLPLHDFEKALFFEGCLPVEELARRGLDTLRFGPLKPVGLTTPDGTRPYAVVQLRQEDLSRSCFNMVGFQSRLTWGEQRRVFRMIPGLEAAEFIRLGQVHRNTFINAPTHLNRFYRLNRRPRVRLAGQITGVEGYLESAATGLAVALYLTLERRSVAAEALPATSALGALARHLVESSSRHFQPANINYGLFPELEQPVAKKERRSQLALRAARALAGWARRHDLAPDRSLALSTR